jgi:Fe-S-cluster containining protein
VWFSDEELTEMAVDKGIERKDFLRLYAHKIHGRWSLNEIRNKDGDYDCVFLSRDEEGRALCDIYKARPTQCRTWPFWRENLSSREAYEDAAEDCPGMGKGLNGSGKFFPVEQIRIMRDETPG